MNESERERGDAREVRDEGNGERGNERRGDMSHGLTKMKLRPVALTNLP